MMNLIRLFLPHATHMPMLDSATWRRVIAVRRVFVAVCLLGLLAMCGYAVMYTPVFVYGNVMLLSAALVHCLNYYALGGYKDMTWSDPALAVVHWLWRPTDAAWMAALDGALDEEFPHWREMAESNPYEAERFVRNRSQLATVWPTLKPDTTDDLAGAALRALKDTETKVGSGGLEALFTYRDWQVAEDRKRDGLAFA